MAKPGPKPGPRAPDWAQHEDSVLLSCYPEYSRVSILKLLPGRTWGAINGRAWHLRVKRHVRVKRIKTRSASDRAMVRDFVKRRLAMNLSQRELGEKIGITQSRVSGFENMGRGFSFFLITAWADALGLEIRAIPKDLESFQQVARLVSPQLIRKAG